MKYTVEPVQESSVEDAVRFLKRHDDYTLFLLGNLEEHGYRLSDEPNSGNFQLIKEGERIAAVFCLTQRGNLLIQSEVRQPIFELVLREVQKENIQLKGLLGEWEFCSLLWSFLKEKNVIKQETFASKEVLYRMDLQKLAFPRQKNVRFLQAGDFLQWKRLRKDYIKEVGLVGDLNDEQLQVEFLRRVQKKICWGLFLDGELVSLADLNAQAFDLGQVGGVYTVPAFRNRGYSKAVMKQLACDAKNVLLLRKLLIFTDVGNQPARSVYESLGVDTAGFYAISFGSC